MNALSKTVKQFFRRLEESEWRLGLLSNDLKDLKSGSIHWVSNGVYKNKWFADPYILDYDDKQVWLLVEEFDYDVHRGRLAKLTVDLSSWTVVDCKIILDLKTHLSFPMIWREEKHIYVCPENYASGALNLYEFNPKSESLTFIKPLISGKLTDATMIKYDGAYYVLSTCEPTPNGKHLSVWKSDSLMGEYKVNQEIYFDENIARNAGCIFEHNGLLTRPAQECNNEYGHAIVFQQIAFMGDQLSFQEVYRYTSTNPKYKYGTHTFNAYKDMAVIDVKGLRYKFFGTLFIGFRNLLVALHLKKKFEFK